MTSKLPAAMAILFALLLALPQTSEAATVGALAVYWGTNLSEMSLKQTCDSEIYDIVSLAFVDKFGGGQNPETNLDGHCGPSNPDGCRQVGQDISYCQQLGIKVLIAIGGRNNTYNLTSLDDARELADYLWTNFLNTSTTYPGIFGEATVNGVDFFIEFGDGEYYDSLADFLKAYDQNMFLTAAPHCQYPDVHLNKALSTGLFDIVWVQFYNDSSCQYSQGNIANLIHSWDIWVSETPAKNISLGLPASNNTEPSGGFIPSEILIHQVLLVVNDSDKYGGVMLWNRYYDLQSGYGKIIKPYVHKYALNVELPLASSSFELKEF